MYLEQKKASQKCEAFFITSIQIKNIDIYMFTKNNYYSWVLNCFMKALSLLASISVGVCSSTIRETLPLNT